MIAHGGNLMHLHLADPIPVSMPGILVGSAHLRHRSYTILSSQVHIAVAVQIPPDITEGSIGDGVAIGIPAQGLAKFFKIYAIPGGMIFRIMHLRGDAGESIFRQGEGICAADPDIAQLAAAAEGIGADAADKIIQLHFLQGRIAAEGIRRDHGKIIRPDAGDLIPVSIPGVAFRSVLGDHFTVLAADIQIAVAVQLPVDLAVLTVGNAVRIRAPVQLAAVILHGRFRPILRAGDIRRHIAESIVPNGGSSAVEIDIVQVGAIPEGIRTDPGKIPLKGDTDQVFIACKGIAADVGNTFRRGHDRDLIPEGIPAVLFRGSQILHSALAIDCQMAVIIQGPLQIILDTLLNRYDERAPGQFATEVLIDEILPGIVTHHEIDPGMNTCKGILRDPGRIPIEGNVIHSGTAPERTAANGCHIAKHIHHAQVFHAFKGIVTDGRQVIDLQVMDLHPVFIPGILLCGGIARHLTSTGQGQSSLIGQPPGDVFAEGATGQEIVRCALLFPGQCSAVIQLGFLGPCAVILIPGHGRYIPECVPADPGSIIMEIDMLQFRAVGESIISHNHTIAVDADFHQIGIALEGIRSYGLGRGAENAGDLLPVLVPGIIAGRCLILHSTPISKVQQTVAVQTPVEVTIFAAGNFIADTIPGQGAAIILTGRLGPHGLTARIIHFRGDAAEGIAADDGRAALKFDAVQSRTAIEGVIANGNKAVRKIDTLQSGGILKGIVTDGSNLTKINVADQGNIRTPGVGPRLHSLNGIAAVEVQISILQQVPADAVTQGSLGQILNDIGPVHPAAVVLADFLRPQFHLAVRIQDHGAGQAGKGILRKNRRRTLELNTAQGRTSAEDVGANLRNGSADPHRSEEGKIPESIIRDIGHTLQVHLSDLGCVGTPGIIRSGSTIGHRTAAADTQRAAAAYIPVKAIIITLGLNLTAGMHFPVQCAAVMNKGRFLPFMGNMVISICRYAGKGILRNSGCIAVLKPHLLQSGTAGESLGADLGHFIQRHILQGLTAGKGTFFNHIHPVIQADRLQGRIVFKSMGAHVGNVIHMRSDDLLAVFCPGIAFGGSLDFHLGGSHRNSFQIQGAVAVHIPADVTIVRFPQKIRLLFPGQITAVIPALVFVDPGAIIAHIAYLGSDTGEGVLRNIGGLAGKGDIIQTGTAAEGAGADAAQIAFDIHTAETGIAGKGVVTDAGNTRHIDVAKAVLMGIPGIALGKRLIHHIADTIQAQHAIFVNTPADAAIQTGGNRRRIHLPVDVSAIIDFRLIGPGFIGIGMQDRHIHAFKGIFMDGRQAAPEIDNFHGRAGKHAAADAGNTRGQNDFLQTGTIAEGTVADGFQGRGQQHGGQIAVAVEGQRGNGGNPLLDHHRPDAFPMTGQSPGHTGRILFHFAGTIDGQQAVFQFPIQGLAAGAAGAAGTGDVIPLTGSHNITGDVAGKIIIRTHGIGGIEAFCSVFLVPDVIVKIGITQQEIGIIQSRLGISGIPGGVHIIVQAIQLHDIPGMGAAVANTADNAVIHPGFQYQSVEQVGIALADSGLVHQCGIGRVNQRLVLLQTRVIVNNVFAHPVIDGANLFIIALAGQIQPGQQTCHGIIHFFLLFGGVVVGHVIAVGQILIALTVRGAADTAAAAFVMEGKIVTLGGHTGVVKGTLKHFVENPGVILCGGMDVNRNGTQPVLHTFPQDGNRFLHGAVFRLFQGLNRGRLHLSGIGDPSLIQGIDFHGNLHGNHFRLRALGGFRGSRSCQFCYVSIVSRIQSAQILILQHFHPGSTLHAQVIDQKCAELPYLAAVQHEQFFQTAALSHGEFQFRCLAPENNSVQVRTMIEGRIADEGHAFWDHDGIHKAIVSKGFLGQFGNRQSVDLRRDHHMGIPGPLLPGIAVDADSAVVHDGPGKVFLRGRKGIAWQHGHHQGHYQQHCDKPLKLFHTLPPERSGIASS